MGQTEHVPHQLLWMGAWHIRLVMQEQCHAVFEQGSAYSSMALVKEAFTCAGQGASTVSTSADRLARTGLVFQFPERHFLASTLQQASHPMLPCLSDSAVLTESTWMFTYCLLWSRPGSDRVCQGLRLQAWHICI